MAKSHTPTSSLLLAGFVLFIALVGIALAAQILGPTSQQSINESRSYIFNFSVNNTDTGGGTANITVVNITLPAGFTFQNGTNFTTATGTYFNNSSSAGVVTLSWNNTNGVITNLSNQSFVFNATANTTNIGFFNITIRLVNASGFNETNVSIQVNDTTMPEVQGANITSLATGQNYSGVTGLLLLNVTVRDNGPLSAVRFNITNATAVHNGTFTASNPNGNIWNTTVNLTVYPDGIYNITVWANDTGNNLNNSARAFTIRFDNTKPEVQEANISAPLSNSNQTSAITLNVTVRDVTSSIGTVFFNITNSSGAQNATLVGTQEGSYYRVLVFNTTGYPDGLYNITIFVNDTANNLNSTALISRVRFDNTAPTVTITRSSSSTLTSVVADVAVTDSGSGINRTCDVDSTLAAVSGSAASQTLTETGLSCGKAISYTVTCYDRVSLSSTATASLAPDGCVTSTGSSSGKSSSTSTAGTTTWLATYAADSQELSAQGPVTRSLGAKERIRVKVGTETHNVGVITITADSVTLEIASTPQSATMKVGEMRKFNTNNDTYYDISVKLVSITNSKASLVIEGIHELITAVEEQKQQAAQKAATATGAAAPAPAKASSSSKVIWTVVIVLVLIILAVVVMRRRK